MNRARIPLIALGIAVAVAAMTGKLNLRQAEPAAKAAKSDQSENVLSDEARARLDAANAVVPTSMADTSGPQHGVVSDESEPGADETAVEPDGTEITEGGTEAVDPTVSAGLAYLDEIRSIPGAAPLLDDIIDFMKDDNGSSFSLDHLEYDTNGLAKIDADTNRKMIKNPEILKKWEKLMALIAENNAHGRKQ